MKVSGGSDFTLVSNRFLDQFMPKANGTFVKVYLYVLRYAGCEIEPSHIAKEMNILESDVVSALKYWNDTGLLSYSGSDVEFLEAPAITQPEKPKKAVLKDKPSYVSREIFDFMSSNEELKSLYSFVEQKLGKVLSPSEVGILFSFYDWLCLPIDVIILLFTYAESIHKLNMRYIEKIAVNWCNNGINTIELAEQFLKEEEDKKALYSRIKKILQISGRELTDPERKYITSWSIEFQMPDELIKKAYEMTVLNTGKVSFAYMNSILKNWFKKGIKTVQEAEEDNLSHKGKTKSSFNNFQKEQENYDFDQLEKAAMQKLFDSVKED